jgi:hypothetical protein
MNLRFGVFEQFKWSPTLLIWGDNGLDELEDLFRGLASGRTHAVNLAKTGWAAAEGDCAVTISPTDKAVSDMIIRRAGQKYAVDCQLSREDLQRFSDQVEALNKGPNGHQYLDTKNVMLPLLIMVSKGEYPATMVCAATGQAL